MPKLRIVIPTKNEQVLLPKLLDSIKKQTFKDFEIIVADASSSDNTRKISESYGCKIVKGGHPHLGRNNGAKNCRSSIISFIDSDILLPDRNFIKTSLKEFTARDLDVAGTLLKPSLSQLHRNWIYQIFYWFSNLGMHIFEKTNKPAMQSLMFARTAVFKDIGGFPAFEFGEDSALAKIAVKKGYKFGILKTSKKAIISPRRLEKNGFFPMLLKYLYFNILRLFGHEFVIDKTKLKYF